MIRSLALLALLTQAPAAADLPRDGFTLLMGRDTIAVERFSRTPARLEGELSLRGAGIRIAYVVLFAADGAPSMVTTWVFRGVEATDPAQKAEMVFVGDSVIVDVKPGGGRQVFASPHGAMPYANPSMAMIEQMVRRARETGRDSTSVNVFLLTGGSTVPMSVTRLGADSVRANLAGVEIRLAVDDRGRLLGGRIPSQGIVLTRFSGDAASVTGPPPDYSAPAGAPYTAEEVRVPCPGGFSLAGTLTRPRGAAGAVPCVVTLTGSGLQDRDESLVVVHGYRPFRQLADALGRAGIATLRLDDRGFGASGGDATKATTADFADDARTALAWLRAGRDVDGARLALLGHSEGGLVAPMVAAADAKLRGIVLLAGPAWTGRRVIEYQNALAIARDPACPAARRDSMLRAAMTQVDSLSTTNPWMRFFLGYDPLPTAGRVRCPVLVMQGVTDRQVDPAQATELATALRKGGNRDVTLSLLPGVNHLFLPDASGDPAGYAGLPEAEIRPAVLATIVDWLRIRLR